jgi:hypothetical protein
MRGVMTSIRVRYDLTPGEHVRIRRAMYRPNGGYEALHTFEERVVGSELGDSEEGWFYLTMVSQYEDHNITVRAADKVVEHFIALGSLPGD